MEKQMYDTFTDHMVDELPDSEVNLQLFQAIARFSQLTCSMAKDGRSMRYAIADLEGRNKYLHMARLTIQMFSLPLVADLDLIEKCATAVKATLTISYTGK